MLGKLPFLCVEQERRGGGEVHATKRLRELHLRVAELELLRAELHLWVVELELFEPELHLRVVELELLCVELHLWVVELELAEPELHLGVAELELETRFCSPRLSEPNNLVIFVHLAALSRAISPSLFISPP